MLQLNIISPELKREIKLTSIYQSLKNLYFFIGSMLLIYSVAFVASDIVLKNYYSGSLQKELVTSNSTENYSEKIKTINEQINYLESMQKEATNWSSLLLSLGEKANNNIKIAQISVNRQGDVIIISGEAKTRDSLLEFKSALENTGYLTEITLPIKSLLEKENINFTISAKFSKYEF